MSQHYKKIGQQFLKASPVAVFLWIEPAPSYYQQETLWVLEDGRFYCADCVLTREELEAALDRGKLAMTVPEGETLFIPRHGRHTLTKEANPVNDRAGWLNCFAEMGKKLQQKEATPTSNCHTYFKEYLIEATDSNLKKLQQEFKKLPVDGQLLFEFSEKDALYQLMQSGEHLDKEERHYILNDYFEEEWIFLK